MTKYELLIATSLSSYLLSIHLIGALIKNKNLTKDEFIKIIDDSRELLRSQPFLPSDVDIADIVDKFLTLSETLILQGADQKPLS